MEFLVRALQVADVAADAERALLAVHFDKDGGDEDINAASAADGGDGFVIAHDAIANQPRVKGSALVRLTPKPDFLGGSPDDLRAAKTAHPHKLVVYVQVATRRDLRDRDRVGAVLEDAPELVVGCCGRPAGGSVVDP